MNKRFVLVGLLLAAGLGRPMSADDPIFYVPVVYANASDIVSFGEDITGFTQWRSSLFAYNNSSSNVTVRSVSISAGSALVPESLCQRSRTIMSDQGWQMAYCFYRPPPGGVAFLGVQASPGTVLHSSVERVNLRCGCYTLDCSTIAQGRTPLPIYRGVFPAGQTVVSGEIELGNPILHPQCASANQQYLRRVNVTLFNAGNEPADFTVVARPVQLTSMPIAQQTITLGPKEVLQVNRFPVPIVSTPGTAVDGGVRIWMSITANQPFLSYVSTVFDDPEPGAQPIEVYESRPAN